MRASSPWSRRLIVIGLAGMILGAIDPLEGSLLIMPASAVATCGALLGKTRFQRLMLVSFLLLAAGTTALFVMSSFGGLGVATGHSYWWALLLAPYPVGWVMGLVGSFRTLEELRLG